MKINWITPTEILDFEKEIGFELIVNERPRRWRPGLTKFYAKFENCEIMEGGCLVSYAGNGNTIDDAIKDYCNLVSDKMAAFNPCTSARREVNFPKLIHTKLLGY